MYFQLYFVILLRQKYLVFSVHSSRHSALSSSTSLFAIFFPTDKTTHHQQSQFSLHTISSQCPTNSHHPHATLYSSLYLLSQSLRSLNLSSLTVIPLASMTLFPLIFQAISPTLLPTHHQHFSSEWRFPHNIRAGSGNPTARGKLQTALSPPIQS